VHREPAVVLLDPDEQAVLFAHLEVIATDQDADALALDLKRSGVAPVD
jgi:hypothetical protein